MFKNLLFLFCGIIATQIIYAQTPAPTPPQTIVNFVAASSSVQEVYGLSKTPTNHVVKVQVQKNGATVNKDVEFDVAVSYLTASAADIKLLNPYHKIPASKFSGGGVVEVELHFQVFQDTIEKVDEFIQLKFKNRVNATSNIATHVITIKNGFEEDGINPFRITVGANFDFKSASPVKGTFYTDAMFLKPDLVTLKDGSSFGLYLSIFHNNFQSEDSSLTLSPLESIVETSNPLPDTVTVVRQNRRLDRLTQHRSTGLEGGLTIRLVKKRSTKANGAKESFDLLAIAPEFATIQRRFESVYTVNVTSTDTLFNQVRPDSIRRVYPREFHNQQWDEVYFGLGFIARYRHDKFGELFFKATPLGVAWYKQYSSGNIPYFNVRVSYLNLDSGLGFGGEVRGFYGRSDNYLGVYISKSFTLKNLWKYE